MARLFTITFPFEGLQYDAQITVNNSSHPYSISVFLPDKKLHHILPDGKGVFEVEDQQPPVAKDAPAVEVLKHHILTAFKAHENQMPPVNMW